MRLALTQKWIVTALVAFALMASPCLSVTVLFGLGPTHVHAAEEAHQNAHHETGNSVHDIAEHRQDGDSVPSDVNCCKLCDAWLSGRPDDGEKAVRAHVPVEPFGKYATFAVIASQGPRDVPRSLQLSPPLAGLRDLSATPLYLMTGRFRI